MYFKYKVWQSNVQSVDEAAEDTSSCVSTEYVGEQWMAIANVECALAFVIMTLSYRMKDIEIYAREVCCAVACQTAGYFEAVGSGNLENTYGLTDTITTVRVADTR